ncbi:hypothetical protein A3461_14245 [Enterobacter roggenkampii]|nr:hypothetical protein A3461_14245 [Enterobacter roggenkampii]
MVAFVLCAISSPLNRLRSAGGIQIGIQIILEVNDLPTNLMKWNFYSACMSPICQCLGIYSKMLSGFTAGKSFI